MKTELSLVGLVVSALALKFFHLPGGSLLYVLSLNILVLFWFVGSFYFFSVKGEKSPTWLSVVAGLAFGPAMVGMLFKIQFWPGANAMLLIGTITSTLALATVIVMQQRRKTEAPVYFRRMLVRTALVVAVSTTLFLTSSKSLFAFFHRGEDRLIELFNTIEDHPEDEAARQAYDDYRHRGIYPLP